MRPRHLHCLGPHGFHRVAYTEWGDPGEARVVVCVHGLTRNGRDFDFLAQALAAQRRVLCPDVVGRGHSDWLTHKDDYSYPLYLSDMAALIARSGAEQVDWVGTSMGGLIGMMLGAKANSPIRRLVLNDVGPLLPWPALARLKLASMGAGSKFASLEEVERHLRETCAPFGPLKDEQWRRLAVHGSRQGADGRYALACDPAIVGALRAGSGSGVELGRDFLLGIDLWQFWETVECPTLVVRGAQSDLLLESTVRRMQEGGPAVQLVEFAGIGHAPWLMSDDQVGAVGNFILAPEPRRG